MRPAIKPEIDDARIITATEVMSWFRRGPKSKPWPSEALCAEVANSLNRMRRGDEPLPVIADDMHVRWVKAIPGDPNSPWVAEPYQADPWWDSEKAADAARLLREDIPAMLWFWRRMRTAPAETRPGQRPMRLRRGYDTIEQLRDALDAAMDYIEWPLGQYDREEARKRHLHPKHPKPWHASAIPVARVIIAALRQSGHTVEGTSHNTIAVRIVRDALARMGFGEIEKPAIAKILIKWADRHGQF